LIKDLLRAGSQLRFRAHRQREQDEQGIKIGLLAELFQAQLDHAIEEGLQLLGQLGRAEGETLVRHHHNHRQVLHLGVELEKAKALSAQAVLEPRLGVHLDLQQHHLPLRGVGFRASGLKSAIEAMVGCFEFGRVPVRGVKPEARMP